MGGPIKVLALDLERTLISDSLRADPRPGLFDFLMFCHERFERVVLFTSVETPDAREALECLVSSGHVPHELLDRLEFVDWSGEHKDLAFVPNAALTEVLLVDDDIGWVRTDQRTQWVPIVAWDGGPDDELSRVQVELERWLAYGK